MIAYLRRHWAARLHFGVLLLVFGELVAWQQAGTYTLPDWLGLLAIYTALGAIALDFIVRFKIDHWRPLLLLAGVFGLARALLLSVLTLDVDTFPIQLILLPLGVQVIMFYLAWWSFRLLQTGEATGLYAFLLAGMVGFFWGTWLHWSPELESVQIVGQEFESALPLLLLGLLIGGAFSVAIRSTQDMQEIDWLLMPYEAAGVGGVLFITLVLRSDQGYINTLAGGILGIVLVMLVTLLYFSRNTRWQHLLKPLTPSQPPLLLGWLLLYVAFIPLAWTGYHAEDGSGDIPFHANLLFRLLFLFGAIWLPVVSTGIGVNIFTRLTREGY